jgi:hypothetical protein
VSGEAQSECPIRALVRNQPPTVPAVRDMVLGHPDQDVSRGCGPRRSKKSCRLMETDVHPRRGLELVIER